MFCSMVSENPIRTDSKKDLPPTYDPAFVEKDWYEWWEKNGFFTADASSEKPKYTIIYPPPNVTGSLHLGHALTISIEDALIRWKRMSGYEVLWLPGTDHAGISCQVVVEKKLQKDQHLSRHDLGREKFIAEVWKWKDEYGSRIDFQARRIGASLDWTRERFTLDEQLSAAVLDTFVTLHRDGLMYREKKLVNWSCALRSAISDLEVEYDELVGPVKLAVPGHKYKAQFGVLFKFAYKVVDSEEEVVVATTRLETMLGDTAVAVNPNDKRYKHLHGKFLVHPFDGRHIPIICDADAVDMEFGTGAVKITPAHDHNDFALGLKHQLPFINIFNDDGSLNHNGAEFQGLMRFDARVAVQKALEEKGLWRGVEDNKGMILGRCSRTGDVVEPIIRPQWWVKCTPLAAPAIKAAEEGQLRIFPNIHREKWFRWLENIQDWCVSRQLWWGHRIPAYYVVLPEEHLETIPNEEDVDRWIVAADEAQAAHLAEQKFGGGCKLLRDPDVLDTWFSSGIFPFSTLGWPNTADPDYNKFYPTDLLETGHDILFFWVARMVMLGMYLTGSLPFKDVFLHPLIRDAQGRKMSKSLGNVVDPLDVVHGITLDEMQQKLYEGNLDQKEIERAKATQRKDFPKGIPACGADGLRFALLSYANHGEAINLDINRIVGYRNFCNKLWNAIKYTLSHITDDFKPQPAANVVTAESSLAERWIMSRLSATIAASNTAYEQLEFGSVTQTIYSFWLYDFCDVFLEISKGAMFLDPSVPENAAKKRRVQQVLLTCVEAGLRLLAPIMPFLTEELWQRLPRLPEVADCDSICQTKYPVPLVSWRSEEAEQDMTLFMDAVREARSIRVSYGLVPRDKAAFYVQTASPDVAKVFEANRAEFMQLVNAKSLDVLSDSTVVDSQWGVRPVADKCQLYIDVTGVVDVKLEVEKLEKKRRKAEENIAAMEARISDPQYLAKAPPALQQANADKVASLRSELDGIILAVERFKALETATQPAQPAHS